MFYGTYFFLADQKIEHVRLLRTITNVLSEYGGLSSIIFNLLGMIGVYINDRLFMGHIVSILYSAKIQRFCSHHGKHTHDHEGG